MSITAKQLLQKAIDIIAQSDSSTPELDAKVLAQYILKVDRLALLLEDQEIPDELAEEFMIAVNRRAESEPIAYILGKAEFYGRDFKVTPEVLIPRPETELIIDYIKKHHTSAASLVDIATGSGCIAITAKLELPQLSVTALDISEEALTIANYNSQSLNANISFLQSDWLSNVSESYDIITANPPYIGHDEELPASVLNFEPHLALFSNNDGHESYINIAQQARKHLNPNGTIILEIGHTQRQAIIDIFTSCGYQFHELIKDYSGLDRVLVFVV